MTAVFHCTPGNFFGRPLFFFIVVFLVTGCARLIQPPEDQPRARALLKIYAEANHDLDRFKGLGHVHLAVPDLNMAGRLAIAAEPPDKLRLEWLSALGQPLLRLAADGQIMAIFSSQTSQVRELKQTDTVLERIVHIPITIESLLSVLAGRMPIYDYSAAQILQESDTHMVVALKDRWSAVLATVKVDLQARRISRFTVFGADGSVRYRINWLHWQRVQGYLLPHEMEIDSSDVHRMKLTMDRYWCNVPLPEGIFSEVVPRTQ